MRKDSILGKKSLDMLRGHELIRLMSREMTNEEFEGTVEERVQSHIDILTERNRSVDMFWVGIHLALGGLSRMRGDTISKEHAALRDQLCVDVDVQKEYDLLMEIGYEETADEMLSLAHEFASISASTNRS